MIECGISYLKAIGIRVHTVRYQKRRNRVHPRGRDGQNVESESWQTSKEYKRMRGVFYLIQLHFTLSYDSGPTI